MESAPPSPLNPYRMPLSYKLSDEMFRFKKQNLPPTH